MIITLDETKQWLRVDHNEEDILIQTLINAAENYLKNATGNTFDSTNELAKLFCLVLVADWYENREMIGRPSEKVRFTVDSILSQLSYCYGMDATAPATPTGLTGTAGDGFVDLSWTANTESDLAGYNIYCDGEKITEFPISGTTYKVTGLTNGTTYSFQISAVDTSGNESPLTAEVSVTPTA